MARLFSKPSGKEVTGAKAPAASPKKVEKKTTKKEK